MTVVNFPRQYRPPLPADAIPSGRDRHAVVCPFEGAWALIETDDGGGSIATGLTKDQAVHGGIELVMRYRGTLQVLNVCADELKPCQVSS
jgi:hypothetical protein